MSANVGAVISEYVQPVACRYVEGFDVCAWVRSRPDVQELLERAKTDEEAAAVFKDKLKPVLESLEGGGDVPSQA